MTQKQTHTDGLQFIMDHLGGTTEAGTVLVILPSLINSTDALFLEQFGPNYQMAQPGLWANINIHYFQAWHGFMTGQAFTAAGDVVNANQAYLQCFRHARFIHVLVTDPSFGS